ncbi:hypothetical protein ASD37_25450 [Mycobacterium sp. Root135]|uniref:hypothetical protein n=1 Tax=Mycobacterium sp. Root135 TaxID=1736457 RepID=UPI0006F7FAB3|nr:hypothetical protein [Mycobacterium sp. Root135]KQY02901.1 hypothetical protein ASD37_25450 [Mycobacterium sp. Root135]
MSSKIFWPSAMVTLATFAVLTARPAAADPPGFPNLDQFTATDPGQFIRPFSHAERWANGYLFFRTTDGISCAIGGSSWCTGDFPGRSDRPGRCDNVQNDGGDVTRPFVFGSKDGACVPGSDPILSAGQKVTNAAFEITCVAGQDGLTACTDTRNGHGFVLQPSGSWVF